MLFLQAQPGEEGENLRAGQPPVGLDPGVERFGGVPDFALAGEEDKDVARRFERQLVDGVADGVKRVTVLLEFVVGGRDSFVIVSAAGHPARRLGQRPVPDFHRECPSGHLDDRGGLLLGAEVLGEPFGIDGGGGDDDFQVGALRQDPLEVPEDEVDVEATLVGLVDDDGVVLAQQLVTLDLRQQDAVGHELDLGGPADLASEADLEAHLLADLDAEFLGNALRHGPGSKAARLGVADQSVLAQAQFQAHLGDLGGLAGAGLAGDDRHLVGRDGGHQVLAALGNRQLGGVGNMKSHGWTQSTAAGAGCCVLLSYGEGPGP
ncbi:hypothetical protein D9M72_285200 [compost metagenome]